MTGQVMAKKTKKKTKKTKKTTKIAKEKKEEVSETETVRVNWQDLLTEDEIIERDGNRFIPLAALERVARIKGVRSQHAHIAKAPSIGDLIAVVNFTIYWEDGTSSTGSGDAHAGNTPGDFGLYLTSMAETRAYARALRRGLGITICSAEEVAEDKTIEDLDDLKSCSSGQVDLINRLLEKKEMTFFEVTQSHSIEGVEEVDDLTVGQAKKFLKWLQSGKNKSKGNK